jgi:hypothetical protein
MNASQSYERKPRSETAQFPPSEGRLTRAEKIALQAKLAEAAAPVQQQTSVPDVVLRGRPSRLEKRLKEVAPPKPVWKTKSSKEADTPEESATTDLFPAIIFKAGVDDSVICDDDGRRFSISNEKLKQQGIGQDEGRGVFIRLGKSWASDNEVVVAVMSWHKGIELKKSAQA